MAKKTMRNDHAAKILFKDYQVTADLLNGYFHDGKKVIHAKDISEADPVLQLPQSGKKPEAVTELLADKMFRICQVKSPSGSLLFGFAGIQNQTYVDYSMPVRDLQAAVAVISDSLRAIKKKNKKSRKNEIFLSPFRKSDRIPGVVMLTVFFSPDNWDGASSLAEIMTGAADYGRYMVNIPCNLIIPARMSDQKCLQYGNTLAPIFLSLKSAGTKEEFEAVFNRYRKLFTSMPVEAFYVINSVLELDLQLDEDEYEGGSVNMCEAIRQIKESSKRQGIKLGRRQGMQKGIQKGIQKGRRQGISENQERIVLNLFDYGDGIGKIAAVLNLSEERIVKILRKHNRILSD